MEAEDFSKSERMTNFNTIKWEGDWNQFKRLFKATARLNGVAEAIRVGELVAQGVPWPEKQPTFENNENLQQYTSELEIAVKEEEESKRQD